MSQRTARAITATVMALLCSLGLPALASAAPGDLDPTFGTGGIALIDFGDGVDKATGMVIQPNGKYLLAGTHQSFGSFIETTATLTRFNADGSLDTSFGEQGRVLVGPAMVLSNATSLADQIALAPDGSILLLSNPNGLPIPGPGVSITRYSSAGILDTSWGSGGSVRLSTSPWTPAAQTHLLVRADGSMLVCLTLQTTRAADVAVYCLNADGGVDSSFGTDGHFILDVAGGSTDTLLCCTLAADGGILIGGQVQQKDGLLLKLTSNGALDPRFGNGGIVLARHNDYVDHRAVYQLGICSDGTIVTADGDGVMMLWYLNRYFADGSADTGWGACPNTALPPGTVALTRGSWGLLPAGRGVPKQMLVAANGSIILSGTKDSGFPAYNDIWLARVNSNGTVDTGFGDQGQVVTDLGGADDTVAAGIDAQGRLLLAAYALPAAATRHAELQIARAVSASGQGYVRYLCGPSSRPSKAAPSKLSPWKGIRGSVVSVVGKNFGRKRGAARVTFGKASASAYVSWSPTRIKCRVPAKALSGRVKVRVVTSAGVSRALVFSVKGR